jgi:hypothetical protein
MKAVKGRYNGTVVVLDEPAPVGQEVEVTVQFPDDASVPTRAERREFSWSSGPVLQDVQGSVSDELLRQRGRFDRSPSGLPEHLPSDEEWKERAARARELFEQWLSEGPSEDLATWEELKAGLEEHPVSFGEIRLDE